MAVTWSTVSEREREGQAGVFIVRIWREPHSPSGFRARIIQARDLRVPQESVSAASTADEVCASVRRWIEEFVSFAAD